MRIDDFNERLRQSILVADGAMGSLLYESVGPQRCVDELNSSDAEAVFRIHQTYIESGAQLIETNTFGANRHKLAQLCCAEVFLLAVVELSSIMAPDAGLTIPIDEQTANYKAILAEGVERLELRVVETVVNAGVDDLLERHSVGAPGVNFL